MDRDGRGKEIMLKDIKEVFLNLARVLFYCRHCCHRHPWLREGWGSAGLWMKLLNLIIMKPRGLMASQFPQ